MPLGFPNAFDIERHPLCAALRQCNLDDPFLVDVQRVHDEAAQAADIPSDARPMLALFLERYPVRPDSPEELYAQRMAHALFLLFGGAQD